MIYVLLGLYAFLAGAYVGEWRTERRGKHATRAHDAIRDAARSAISARRYCGNGVEIYNVSDWTLGKDKFQVTVTALDSEINLR